jgi:hypothetical protein
MNIPIPAASFISSSQGAELVMKSIRLHWIADVVLLMALTIPILAWTSEADSGLAYYFNSQVEPNISSSNTGRDPQDLKRAPWLLLSRRKTHLGWTNESTITIRLK